MDTNTSKLLDEVLKQIPNAKKGLPQEVFYFISQLTPMINVDLLIKNKLGQTLLTWRDDKYYGPAWHIPGGIIRFKESIEDRVLKVAESELGCKVNFNPEPINVRSQINRERDIRGHFISLLYLCEVTTEPELSKKFNGLNKFPLQGEWSWHNKAPQNLLAVHESFRKFINEQAPL
jgi:ADP-ribose pyrophosphatase YjhB (NUDIX family)